MNIQSLSVCVPAGCPNDCKFCVSKMKRGLYVNQIEGNKAFRHLYKDDYKTRLEFARDNGCNTMVLTGDGEPLANRRFLEDVLEWNQQLSSPFRHIDLQTSGVGLIDDPNLGAPQPTLRWLRNAGVTTIALSLSALWDNENASNNGTPDKLRVNIHGACSEIKRYDFNLRLSLNMTSHFEKYPPQELFEALQDLRANQVTLRVLYTSGTGTEQDEWIEKFKACDELIADLNEYIHENGRRLERLPFGASRYAVGDMSVVLDDDCMATEVKETIRYLVLRPDCKLYSHWDEKGSLIF